MHSDDEDSDPDSLFDEPLTSPRDGVLHATDHFDTSASFAEPPTPVGLKPAQRAAPPIPGLYFDPSQLLPGELAEDLLQRCLETYFRDSHVNQVMLFERAIMESMNAPRSSSAASSGIPEFLKDLLQILSKTLHPILPRDIHELLFPPPDAQAQARQVIINLYTPGEGITPHVDLLDRFGDGIIGVSLGSGCVMQFKKVGSDGAPEETDHDHRTYNTSCAWDVFLPHGSVYVMSDEARYQWMHGIDGRREDWVRKSKDCEAGRWVPRSIRVSITFRWLLPGADLVGDLKAT